MRHLLNALGYRNIDDAIEFVMAGLALLPLLMFLTGNAVLGAVCLIVLIILLASLGMHAPPPPAPHDKEDLASRNKSHPE
jgi:hypothetical protein